jgi:transposase
MQIVYRRCCGLDVHKKSLTACVLVLGEQGERQVRKKEFATHWKALQKLKLWLYACKVEHVALAHGLLRPSFVPPREIQELRDLTRYRVKLVGEYNRVHNRISKVLEDANLKLGSVASDILGVTGRMILRKIADGHEHPDWLADRALSRLRHKREELRLALIGRITDHHRYLLRELLDDVERSESKITRLEGEIVRRMQPYEKFIERLITIPGVDVLTAWTVLAELGIDMTQFPDADHAASWAGLVPGSYESAGKRKSTRTRHGNRWLRRALCQSAWAVAHKKDCYLTAHFYRRASRHGMRKAIIATAHQILIIAFHIIRDGTVYQQRGGEFFDRLNPTRTTKRLTQRLERLGFQVVLKPTGPPPTPPPPRRRGRPYKCVERAIDCKHKLEK